MNPGHTLSMKLQGGCSLLSIHLAASYLKHAQDPFPLIARVNEVQHGPGVNDL
jgi:hypothetical protein